MPHYSEGKIYMIKSDHSSAVYIGSTCQSLRKRFNGHRGSYAHYLRGEGGYISSYELLKYYDARIELIEVYPSSSKIELHAREAHYIMSMECVNTNVPGGRSYHRINVKPICPVNAVKPICPVKVVNPICPVKVVVEAPYICT